MNTSGFRVLSPEAEKEREHFKLNGRSVLDLLDLPIDPSSNLLGNRWLTRDGSAFVIAPSGHGKSSFSLKAAICWAIGRTAFGIKPSQPIRILIIQSEDDDAESKKFVQLIRKMKLTEEERSLLQANTPFEYRRDLSGDRFIHALDDFLTQWPADMVIINPLSGFLLCDLTDTEKVGDFLRNRLNGVLAKHSCAALIFHHTPKTNYTKLENMQWYDWMYAMTGCAGLTQWARAVLVIVPSKLPGTYRFIAAKRFDEIKWTEREYWYAHSREAFRENGADYEIIDWIPATETQIAAAKPIEKNSHRTWSALEVHKKMSVTTDYSRHSFRAFCREQFAGMSRETSDEIRATLVADGLIEEIQGEGKGAARNKIIRKIRSRDENGAV